MKTIAEQITRLINGDVENFQPEPGKVYSGLPNDHYHACEDYESSTTVKKLLVTVKHRLDMERKETDALAFGTLFHDSMETLKTGKALEEFSRVIDDFKRNAKEPIAQFILKYYPIVYSRELGQTLEDLAGGSKQTLLDMAEDLERRFLNGRQKVTTENFTRSQAMVEAIKNHPAAGRLIKLPSFSELSFFAEVPVDVDDMEIPVRVRVRPDDLIEFDNEVWINDWKSIGVEATDANIKKACWQWRYDLQAAMYFDVVSRFTDKPVFFRLVFAESVNPSKEKVRIVQLAEWDLEAGWADYRRALENKARWIKDKSQWIGFPIPADGIDFISMRTPQHHL